MKSSTPFSATLRITALILSVVTAVMSLPVYVFSAEFKNGIAETYETGILPDSISSEEAAQNGFTDRVPSLEDDLYSYVFSKYDGTFETLTYDYPVKYYDSENRLQDKSNQLKEEKTDDGTVYIPESNDIKTVIPADLSKGIGLEYKDINVRMVYMGNNSKDNPEETPSARAVISENKRSVSYNLTAKSTLDYSLTYNGFKEEIVLGAYEGITDWSFLLYTGGLGLAKSASGDINLVDDNNNAVINIGRVVVLTADEKNNCLGEMIAETVEKNRLYRITIHIDEEYLESSDTAYPIRIDPSLEIAKSISGAGAIKDITVSSTINYSESDTYLLIGTNASHAKFRAIVGFPTLYSSIAGKNIVSASFELRDLMCESQHIEIECCRYRGNSWINNNAFTWAGMGYYPCGEVLSTREVFYGNGNVYGAPHRYAFDITSLVQDWADGKYSPNYGIILKATDEFESGSTTGYKTFASYNRSSKQPSLRYSWVEPNGIGASYEYNTRQIANGISACENIYFGNITLLHPLNIPTLNDFPLNTNIVYNTSYGNTEFFDKYGFSSSTYGSFGYGVKPGFVELLTVVNDSYGDPSQYSYIDGNGTEFYFTYNRSGNNFINDSLKATVTRNSDGSAKLEAEGVTRNFNSAGLLTSVIIENEDEGNETFVYNYSSSRLISITKNSRTLVTLGYSGSVLTSVSYPVVIGGTSYTNSINLTYSGGRLNSISDIYGNITDYSFTVVSGNISSLNIYDRLSQTGAQYSFSNAGKITAVSEYRVNGGVNGTRTNTLVTNISRGTGRVEYTENDTNGKKTAYVFDNAQRLVNTIVTDRTGSVIYSADFESADEDSPAGYMTSFGSGNILAGENVNANGKQVYLSTGTYTFSAYANCEGVCRINRNTSGGVYLWVKNGNGTIISTSAPLADVPDGTGYLRIYTTFTVSSAGYYTVGYGTDNITGRPWLEGFMLEIGSEPTTYSYISASSQSIEAYENDYLDISVPCVLNGIGDEGRLVFSGFVSSDYETFTHAIYVRINVGGPDYDNETTVYYDSKCEGMQYICCVLPAVFTEHLSDAEYFSISFNNDSEYCAEFSHIILTYQSYTDYYPGEESDIPEGTDEQTAEEENPFETEKAYDSNGNVISTTVRYKGENTSGQGLIFSEAEYDSNGFITSYTDSNGIRYDYVYNRYGEITESRLYTGTSSYIPTYYTYYSNGLVKEISCDGKSNEYIYSDGQISQIRHKNGSTVFETYSYRYDNQGNVLEVKVGNRSLEEYTYTDPVRGLIQTRTYGNGDTETYTYDGHGSVLGKRINGETKYAWSYSLDGTLLRTDDFENGTTEITYTNADGFPVLTKTYRQSSGGNTSVCSGHVEIVLPDSIVGDEYGINTSHDAYGRTRSEIIQYTNAYGTRDLIIKESCYPSSGRYSDGLISTEYFSDGGYDGSLSNTEIYYTYDSRGNITGISETNDDYSGYVQKFYYDNLSQLIREDNEKNNTTVVYTYDCNGNITQRKTYSYSPNVATANLGSASSTVNYSYTDSNWKDLLTGIGGKTISSDVAGNPLNWTGTGSALSWTGRTLDSYTPDGQTHISYKYNAEGLRTQKTVVTGSTTTVYDYFYDDGNLSREIRTARTGSTVTGVTAIDYIYLDGQVQGFRLYNCSGNTVNYNSYEDYFYGYTHNGEIRLIYDDDGSVAARYSYDAWGNVISIDGYYASTIGALNTIRYKGYYYDIESEWYYLQSRYYDPGVGRFISADHVDLLWEGTKIFSLNLSIYCLNQPLKYVDNQGNMAVPFLRMLNNVYSANIIDSSVLSLLVLALNGLGIYTAFHEIAQIIISKKLKSIGYSNIELETRIKKGEADITASKDGKRFVWEVKPLGKSAFKQIQEYTSGTGYKKGPDIGTIKGIEVFFCLKMTVIFDGIGGAYYYFYTNNGRKITNAELYKALITIILLACSVSAAIIIATLAEDIVSFGIGIWNDAVSFIAAASSMMSIIVGGINNACLV